MSAPVSLPAARALRRAAGPAALRVTLDYEGRFLRRKVLTADDGTRFLVDLAETVSVEAGDAFVLDTGALVGVAAAPEPLTEIRADPAELARLAWHIGNRHTPCRIEPDRLLIRRDRVLSDMLVRLGARLSEIDAPFLPEGGAYGHGRTHGHTHGEAEGGPHHHHGHEHHHVHDHGHGHEH